MTVLIAPKNLRLRIPRLKKPSTKYIVSKSGDTILLQPFRMSILDAARAIPDPNPPSLEEIAAIVHEVRRETKSPR